jgi:gliding motility-associated-like protein
MLLRTVACIIFCGIFSLNNNLSAQNFTTRGKTFWLGFMQNYSGPTLTVYISSDVATTGTISIPAQGWTQNFNVTPGVATAVPVPTAQAQNTGSGAMQPMGVRVTTADSVSVFALNYEPYTSDASVILPIQTIGNAYYVSAYKDAQAPYSGNSELLIVGCYPNTVVEITPKVATVSGNPANVPFQITINPGQTYQVQATGDLTGTLVKAIDNGNGCPNFALFAGNICTGVQCAYCDHLYEQMYPINALGTKYILPPLRTRSSDKYRIIGTVNNTQISINGNPSFSLNAGNFYEFNIGTPSYINASSPVAVAQFSRGSECDFTNSDPFMIMLSPIEQTLQYVTFNAFTSAVISAYYLNVVTKTAYTNRFTIDGAAVTAQFNPVPSNPTFSYAQLNITQGDHTLQSDSGFVAYVYGYGNDESYGYPVGANLTNLFARFTYAPADSTLDTTYICPNTPLKFVGRGDTTVATYEWDFGDGTFGTGKVQLHAYANFGVYTVKMIISRPNACGKDTLSDIIRVLGPRPNLIDEDTLCAGVPLTLTSAPADFYTWNTGATTQSITVSPTITTQYWVQIRDSQCMGAPDSVMVYVSNPNVDFSFNEVCLGDSVFFTNLSTTDIDTVTSYSWNFGDGSSSSDISPAHYFITGGNFNVSLTMNTSLGCTKTVSKPLVNHPYPVPAFTVQNVCNGVAAQFNNTSTISLGNITSNNWDFGDASTSQSVAPSHLYADTGNYTVQLITVSDFGCADTVTNTVRVYEQPDADWNVTNECQGIQMNFIPVFNNLNWNYQWNFGDANTSSVPNASHTYQSEGSYIAKLIITTADGCTDSVSKPVTVYPNPQPSFTFQNVCDGVAMQFNNTSVISSGNYTSAWSFGDGSSDNQFSPSHLYPDSGIYNVKLVLLSDNNCTDSITQSVRVYLQPVAGFTLNNQCFGTPISFTNNSTAGSNITYNWNFDDGTSDNTTNPTHNYSTADSFNVELHVTTSFGCEDSITNLAVVYPLPRPQFNAADVCLGFPTVFTNTSAIQSGNIQQYNWSFGDGNLSQQQSPSNTYAAVGIYNVRLVLVSALGCTDSVQKTVEVFPLPTATTGSTIACNGENNANATVYPNAGTPPYTFSWSDGQASDNAILLYAGNYDVTITDANNCAVTASETVIQQPFPVIIQTNFAIDSIMFGDTIEVVSVSGNYDPYLTYIWKPSEGLGCDTCTNTFAAPLQTTTYIIEAVDTMGCRGTTSFEVVVLNEYIIYIPNAFSPDGDGVNETFRVYSKGLRNMTLQIFNRWGEKMFESNELTKGWDGYYKGKEQIPEVYVYVAYLEFLDGYKTIKKGSLTIVK